MKNHLKNNYHKYVKNRKLTTRVTVRKGHLAFYKLRDVIILDDVTLYSIYAQTNRSL